MKAKKWEGKKSKVSFRPSCDINKNNSKKKLSENIQSPPTRFRKTEFFNTEIISPASNRNVLSQSISIKPLIRYKHQPFKYLYSPNDPEQFLVDHEFLHEEIKNKNSLKFFIFFDILRQLIIVISFVSIRLQPLAQMVFINVFNFGFIIWFVWKQPFIKLHLFFFTLVNEICIQTAFISVLALVFMDVFKSRDIETRINFGWVTIFANLALVYWIIISALLNIIIKIVEKIREKNKVYSNSSNDDSPTKNLN